MAYAARPHEFHSAQPYRQPAAKAVLPPPRRRFWRRMIDRILDAQQRDAQRAVERYVARRGKLTDSMEREIAERLMRHF